MLYNISFYFFLFMIYSIFGWIVESIAVAFTKRKWINRGFLIGPYCPIYGFAAITIIFLFSKYSNEPFVLFILTATICTILEYITSYIMEKLFNARWWDYSHLSFNINGRVCLKNSIYFGLLGCILLMFLNPLLSSLISYVEPIILIVSSGILFLIFLIDNIISFKIITKFAKTASDLLKKDNTEEISKKVHEILSKKSIWLKRLAEAFPNFKAKLPNIKAKYEQEKNKIKQKLNRN